jgi:hypothetical protein
VARDGRPELAVPGEHADATAVTPARPVPPGGCRGATRPPVDITRIVIVGELVAGAIAVTWRLAGRQAAPKAYVRMGPGGWVSLKGGSVRLNGRRYRPLRKSSVPAGAGESGRPRWARLLRAHRVT